MSSDPDDHVRWLEPYRELGVETVYLFNVNRDQHGVISTFGERVLPRLAG